MPQLFWEGGFGMIQKCRPLTITEMSIDLERSWSFCKFYLNTLLIILLFFLNPLFYLNFYLHASLTFPLLYVFNFHSKDSNKILQIPKGERKYEANWNSQRGEGETYFAYLSGRNCSSRIDTIVLRFAFLFPSRYSYLNALFNASQHHWLY